MSAYIAPEFAGDPDKLRLLDLVFKTDCKNSTVEKPVSIVIQHPDFDDNHLDIGIQEMLINQYAKDHALVGFDNQLPLSRIEAGQFFETRDPQAYYFWRSTLPRVLKRTTMSDHTAGLPADEAARVYEFFTHLLLAATFYYTDPDCVEGSC